MKGTQLLRGRNTLTTLLALAAGPDLKCRLDAASCLALEGVGIGLAAAGPYLLKILVDGLSAPHTNLWPLLILVLGFVVAWTGTSVLTSLRNICSTRINSRLTQYLTVTAMSGYLGNGTWRTSDGDRFRGLLERLPYSLVVVMDGLVWRTLPLVLQLVLSLAIISRLMSWRYVLVFAVLACVFVATSWFGLGRQVSAAERYNEAISASGGLVGDILGNARRVVSNGAVNFEVDNVRSVYRQRETQEVKYALALVHLSALQWVSIALSLFILLGFAAADITQDHLTAADFILLQAYAIRLLVPLAGVGFILSQTTSAIMTIREVLGFGVTRDVVTQNPIESQKPRPARIEVRHLTYTYPNGRGGVHDVNVDFPAGSFSVIVGKNGSGKSTLAQLMAGQLSPSGGEIHFDGRPLQDATETERVRQVLYVPQRTTLLNRDLRSNLFYPPANHSEAEAVRLLQAWDFYGAGRQVELDWMVGSQGDNLSGGQVQKLELARLVGVQVPCLILDESTSALDPVSETRIIADLRKAIGVCTTIILVTHRESQAAEADQVIWVADGNIAGVGGHVDMILGFEEYRRLWRTAY